MTSLRTFFNFALMVTLTWSGASTWRDLFPACPQCGRGGHPIPILYGLPEEEALARARNGEIHLGGCYVTGLLSDPHWYCTTCGERWGTPGEMVLHFWTFWLAGSVVLCSGSGEWIVTRLRARLRKGGT
jgi:hypothetical protein